jgi:hypothetical protein
MSSASTVNVRNLPGLHGADYFADTAAHAGRWQSITALADSVVTLEAGDWGGNAPAGMALPAGVTVHGAFKSITLASGAVVAYRAG